MLFFPFLLFTIVLLCDFQKPLVSVFQSQASPPTLLDADGIIKPLSKMHASIALPSPSTLLPLVPYLLSIYPLLLLLFRQLLLMPTLSTRTPTHTHTHRSLKQESKIKDAQRQKLWRWLGITVHL